MPLKKRSVARMGGITTMVEYTDENDIKAYELEPTYQEIGGGGGGYPAITVTIKNEDDASANLELYGYNPNNNDHVLDAIFNDNNNKYYYEFIQLSANETLIINSELIGSSFMIMLGGGAASGTGDVTIAFDETWEMDVATVTGNCEITLANS